MAAHVLTEQIGVRRHQPTRHALVPHGFNTQPHGGAARARHGRHPFRAAGAARQVAQVLAARHEAVLLRTQRAQVAVASQETDQRLLMRPTQLKLGIDTASLQVHSSSSASTQPACKCIA